MLKLMIVDDEPLICTRLKNEVDFTSVGYIVCATAHSGKQALKLMDNELPDVLLVDIMMPDMNGLTLIEAIRKRDNAPEIIILSGYDEFRYAQRALELGVHQYLLKPVNPVSLCQALSHLTQKRETASTLRPQTFDAQTASLDGKHIIAAIELRPVENRRRLSDSLSLLAREAAAFFPSSHIGVIESPLFYLAIPCRGSTQDVQQAAAQLRNFRRRFLCAWDKWNETQADKEGHDAICCHIGVGFASVGQDGLRRSKQLAMEMLEYAYFSDDSAIAAYDLPGRVIRQSQPVASSAVKKEVASIVYYVLQANLKAAISHLRAYFETNYRYVCDSRQNFLMECNLFYLLIGLLIEENGFSEIVESAERFYTAISALENYSSVLAHFEGELARISTQVTGIDISRDNSVVFRIKQYMLKNYGHSITLKELSENMYLSPSYLSSYFKKHTGQTVSEYLIMIRIEQAKHLLAESNLTVNQIAEQVGYPGYRYFCTLFKQVTGVTPVHYRLNHMTDRMIKE